MVTLMWFGLAALALILALVLWWAESLQRDNRRLRHKVRELEHTHELEIELQRELLRGLALEDRSRVFAFPGTRRGA